MKLSLQPDRGRKGPPLCQQQPLHKSYMDREMQAPTPHAQIPRRSSSIQIPISHEDLSERLGDVMSHDSALTLYLSLCASH